MTIIQNLTNDILNTVFLFDSEKKLYMIDDKILSDITFFNINRDIINIDKVPTCYSVDENHELYKDLGMINHSIYTVTMSFSHINYGEKRKVF